MAVYTDVSDEELQEFLAGYDLGTLLAYKGIAEGVENSNFLLHTSSGYFILTLYEKRVAETDLPFFLSLMEHLAARGLTCPQPVRNRAGDALGRLARRPAAIVTFLDGMWIRRPSAAHCARCRRGACAAPSRRRRFQNDSASTALSVDGWRALVRGGAGARRHRAAGAVRGDRGRARRSSSAIGRATCRKA